MKTLRPERFLDKCELQFVYHLAYTNGDKFAHRDWSRNRFYANGSKRRTDLIDGPMRPDGARETLLESVSNGTSSAYRNSGVAIASRGHKGNEYFNFNVYLFELGIPLEQRNFDDARQGLYFIPQTVRTDAGYQVDEETTQLDGVPCRIVRHGEQDRLWFDTRGPVRLLQRDVWDARPKLVRRVIQYLDYKDDLGLPMRIVDTIYEPADKVGDKTKVEYKRDLQVEKIAFEAPSDDLFVLNIDPGYTLVDDLTKTEYIVHEKSANPFEQIVADLPRYSVGRFSNFLWVNVILGLLVSIIVGVNVYLKIQRPASLGPPRHEVA